jgi:hypothetical protein
VRLVSLQGSNDVSGADMLTTPEAMAAAVDLRLFAAGQPQGTRPMR